MKVIDGNKLAVFVVVILIISFLLVVSTFFIQQRDMRWYSRVDVYNPDKLDHVNEVIELDLSKTSCRRDVSLVLKRDGWSVEYWYYDDNTIFFLANISASQEVKYTLICGVNIVSSENPDLFIGITNEAYQVGEWVVEMSYVSKYDINVYGFGSLLGEPNADFLYRNFSIITDGVIQV